MTDDDKALVERLREEADEGDEPKSHDEFDMRGLLHGAADEIERLRGFATNKTDELANILEAGEGI